MAPRFYLVGRADAAPSRLFGIAAAPVLLVGPAYASWLAVFFTAGG